MPSVFTLIGNSWDFAKKQTVLLQAAFWLLFLPMVAINELSSFVLDPRVKIDVNNGAPVLLSALCMLIVSVVLVWGLCCILLIGSRQLGAASGRSRTSFKAVRTEAGRVLIPMILTGILRNIITILWGLLLIIPGIIYSIRTVFYPIILVTEGISYRPALQRSKDIVRGHSWHMFFTLLLLTILLFLPARIVDALSVDLPLDMTLTVLNILSAVFTTVATVLYTLSLIELYGAMKPSTKPIIGGGKKKAAKKK